MPSPECGLWSDPFVRIPWFPASAPSPLIETYKLYSHNTDRLMMDFFWITRPGKQRGDRNRIGRYDSGREWLSHARVHRSPRRTACPTARLIDGTAATGELNEEIESKCRTRHCDSSALQKGFPVAVRVPVVCDTIPTTKHTRFASFTRLLSAFSCHAILSRVVSVAP